MGGGEGGGEGEAERVVVTVAMREGEKAVELVAERYSSRGRGRRRWWW